MSEKFTIIAPWGDHMEYLYPGIRDFPTERIILITPDKQKPEALKLRNELVKFRIPVDIKEIKGNIWEETFKAIAEVKSMLGENKNILVNVATGDIISRCAATSAAFVNGLKAFAADQNGTMLLPVLKFSYYRILSDKKMHILKILDGIPEGMLLDEVAKKVKMSLPLLSYHLNGNLKSEGLKELGLIETEDSKGRITVRLSIQGRLLVKGYLN
jgi:DNA-binding transcriptional ArsR family regulator